MSTQPAFELIGPEGTFRMPGGRTNYEAVLHNLGRATKVRLARLDTSDGTLRQINRYVDWEQPIEVVEDFDAEVDNS